MRLATHGRESQAVSLCHHCLIWNPLRKLPIFSQLLAYAVAINEVDYSDETNIIGPIANVIFDI